jgi:hypothetical protein
MRISLCGAEIFLAALATAPLVYSISPSLALRLKRSGAALATRKPVHIAQIQKFENNLGRTVMSLIRAGT